MELLFVIISRAFYDTLDAISVLRISFQNWNIWAFPWFLVGQGKNGWGLHQISHNQQV